MRNRTKYPVIENVEVLDIADGGKAIAKVDDLVVFLSRVVPGDVIDIQPKKWKKNFMEADVVKIATPSDKRISPPCEHFGVCGGCKWQNMQYGWQLHYKQKQVEENMRRIGKIAFPPVLSILPSEKTFYYRNKLEFTFSAFPNSVLGFHAAERFDRVLDVNRCHLQPDPSNNIRLSVKNFALENKIPFFDIQRQTGIVRNLIIRTSSTGDIMVIISFFKDDPAIREKILNHLEEKFPEITALMYVINPKGNDTIFDLEIKLHRECPPALPTPSTRGVGQAQMGGKDHIMEKIRHLKLRIGPKSFFQVNTPQAERLFRIIEEFAGLKGGETVYDLYTGGGAIALFLAHRCKKIFGIEYVADAIEDAKINATLNGISNAEFFAGDIKHVLNNEFISQTGKPDVIIADPPRSGILKQVVEKIIELKPERFVYVSCNPATQARDIALMADYYTVEKIQPVDMFPHTQHVESVALLVMSGIKKHLTSDI